MLILNFLLDQFNYEVKLLVNLTLFQEVEAKAEILNRNSHLKEFLVKSYHNGVFAILGISVENEGLRRKSIDSHSRLVFLLLGGYLLLAFRYFLL